MHLHHHTARRGSIVPLLAVTIVAVFALVALAVDIGLIALARTHCQNAADAAAMAAVRQLNGDSEKNNNYDAAGPAAQDVATANRILNAPITSGMVRTDIGYYAYNSTQQRFEANLSGTKPASENWSAARVTVSATQPTFFAKVLGVNSLPAEATATAVHRPRDVVIVLDFSASMKYSSEPVYPSNGDIQGSLNPDGAYPKFGHYSVSGIANRMYRTTTYIDGGGETHAVNNFTVDTDNGPPIVRDFLYRDASGILQNAFHRITAPYDPMTWACPAPSNWDRQGDSPTAYVGDKWPRYNKSFVSGNYAVHVWNFLNGTNPSYSEDHNKSTEKGPGGGNFDPVTPSNPANNEGYGPNFKGYVMGPGYYGKTFFYWPPDPRFHPSANTSSPDPNNPAKDTNGRWMGDWRKRFFYNGGTTTPLDGDNSRLWDYQTGQWRQASSSTYAVNYSAILAWLKSGPKVLPPNLRAGRVLYYSSIPDSIPATGGTPDQRFWRSYIDYVIGNGDATTQRRIGYGRRPDSDNAFGTARITRRSRINGANNQVGDSDDPYMNYSDNPVRPLLQFWFGPVSMLCFLSDNNSSNYARNWMPGTSHESQCWQLKAGVNAALDDIRKNHPNDWVALNFFSSLQEYTTPRVSLGRDYARMKNALFFPFSTLDHLADINYEVRPYNNSFADTAPGDIPNANGSTSPECGFMVAYNQLSSRTGFNGRRGAAKMVIFETDGVPNTPCDGSFSAGSPAAYNSSYTGLTVRSNIGNGNSTVLSRAKAVAARICALDTANPPGYSSARVPARIHAIAFGDLFETNSSTKDMALQFLVDVQKIGNTSPSNATSLESYKIIVGDYDTRIENLRQSLERIFQSGVQVSLIR